MKPISGSSSLLPIGRHPSKTESSIPQITVGPASPSSSEVNKKTGNFLINALKRFIAFIKNKIKPTININYTLTPIEATTKFVKISTNLLNQLQKIPEINKHEGIFRISPSHRDLDLFIAHLNKKPNDTSQFPDGKTSKFPSTDLLAAALKKTLKEIKFFNFSSIDGKEINLELVQSQVIELPEEKKILLINVLKFLNLIVADTNLNKMNATNLGTVLGMSFFSDADNGIEQVLQKNDFFKFLIEHSSEIFPEA